jgi:hypothetical protein
MEGDEDGIIKQDRRGRVCVSRERREGLLAEFDRSGMSGAEFAAHYGIKYSTFAGWRTRRRRREREEAAEQSGNEGRSLQLAEVVLEGSSRPGTSRYGRAGLRCLEIELPGGARMLVGGPEQAALAAELLGALGGSARERTGC